MKSLFNLNFSSIIFGLIALVPALCVHEYSHGWMATKLGDNTPRLQGRLSLNPMRHLDPIGALMLIFVGFGWAKPVQVNPLQFRGNRKTGMVLVALAGPLSNLILAYLGALILRLITSGLIPYNSYFGDFFAYFIMINVTLAIFNLIPLPPLDGWRIIGGLIPSKYYFQMQSVSRYSMLIIIVLMFTGVLNMILSPAVNLVGGFMFKMAGLG